MTWASLFLRDVEFRISKWSLIVGFIAVILGTLVGILVYIANEILWRLKVLSEAQAEFLKQELGWTKTSGKM